MTVRFLPYLCAAIQLGAAITYSVQHEWRLSLVWGLVGLSNVAFAGIK